LCDVFTFIWFPNANSPLQFHICLVSAEVIRFMHLCILKQITWFQRGRHLISETLRYRFLLKAVAELSSSVEKDSSASIPVSTGFYLSPDIINIRCKQVILQVLFLF